MNIQNAWIIGSGAKRLDGKLIIMKEEIII
jgi:hypothetical protein